MPPRRVPPRGTTAKKDSLPQKDKVNTSAISTRASRAAKRAASQAPSEAPEPPASSSQHDEQTTLSTTPRKRASRAKAATTKKPGKNVENTTSTFEPHIEEPTEGPIPTPKPADRTRGRAKAEVHPGDPIPTRQTRGKKPTAEPEPKPADNDTKQRATRKNTNIEKVEVTANVPKLKARATRGKREHIVVADEDPLNDATQGTPKLRKVGPGPVSNSRRSEEIEETSPKRRKPRQKKPALPLPINDPFLEEAAPITEAQTIAPKGRLTRGKKGATALVEQAAEEVDPQPEAIQSNTRSLRARKAQPPPPTPKVQRSGRAKTDKGKGKAADPDPAASQNDATEDFPAQQQEIGGQIAGGTAIPRRRGRLPKATEEHTEVDSHLGEEPITPVKPERPRRVTKAAVQTPVRRSERRNQAAEPEAGAYKGTHRVAVVIEKIVVGEVTGGPVIPEVVEQSANAETDEEVEEKAPVAEKKAVPKRKGGRKPAKGRGKKAAKPVEEGSDQEAGQAIEGQPEEQPEEESGKDTGSSQGGIGIMAAEPGEVSNVSEPVAPEITATTAEPPVAPLPTSDNSPHGVEDNLLSPTLSQTPIPAPVSFSPSRPTQSFSEPMKSPTPVPSSPLARFSSKSPIVNSKRRDFDDDVTPRWSSMKRSRSNPSTPLASSSKAISSGVGLTTPNQLNMESTSYSPKATIRHLDVASSPILHPPRNADEGERPGKSPVKNATPRSSLDPVTSMNLFGGVESNRWAGSSPRRRSSGVSPMKRQSMSFTEFGESGSQVENDGIVGGDDDDDAGAQTEEDSEFQQDEDKGAQRQLTPSKDQEAEIDSDFEAGTGVAETETLATQVDMEEYTPAAQVYADGDSESEHNEDMDQHQDVIHAEDDQEEAFVDDSTFNNDSLFAIPAEDIPVDETARSQTVNTEEAPEEVAESVAENVDKNTANRLGQPSIDAVEELLPTEAQEYYENTIENINESSLMLQREMGEIRSRTPTLGGFYQRSSLRETEPSNLSGIFAPGLQLSETSLVPADRSNSFTFDYSAIRRELETSDSIDQQATSGLPPIQENEDGEEGSLAGYPDILPDYLTEDSNYNISQRPNSNSGLVTSSPMSESAVARAISFFEENSVLEGSRVENDVRWDDQSLVETLGEFNEELSQDGGRSIEVGQKTDDPAEVDQGSPQSDVQNEESLCFVGSSRENVLEHDSVVSEGTIQGPMQNNEAGGDEEAISGPKQDNEVGEDEHTMTKSQGGDITTIISNAVVESVTTSQESIFTKGSPKESFTTSAGSFESSSIAQPVGIASETAIKVVDNLLDARMAVSTPEVNRTHKFSLPPRFTPTGTPKRSLADSPITKRTPNAPSILYGMKPEDIPDFDDDFSAIEATPSDQKTPAAEQQWVVPAGSDTPQRNMFSSPSKPKSLLSKLLQGDNFEFTDDFSFIEDEKEAVDRGEDGGDRGENNEKIRGQLGESPGRASPRTPLGEVQISAGPITMSHAVVVDDTPTGKRKIGTLEPMSAKRGKHDSSSFCPEAGDATNEEISVIDVEAVIGDRKYARPKGRRQSLRLSYLDSAASNTVSEPEPQGEAYLTPEKSRFQNLNPLFSACPDSVQAKRRGRRTSIGQRRESLQLEENVHMYTRIQAAVRGYICRKKLKEVHEGANEKSGGNSDNRDETPDKVAVQRDLAMAAEVFVSAWKGLKQRRAYLTQRAAATTIQRAYRKRQAAVSQLSKPAISVSKVKAEEPVTPVSTGPFDGLLKRFDEKKAAGTAATPEPESSEPAAQPVVHVNTPRPRRMATQSPVPEKYIYKDPNKYKRAVSAEPELGAVVEPPIASAGDEAESKTRPTRALGSRIPRSGLRLPAAAGMSTTSIGKRKAEDDIGETFVPKFKLNTTQARPMPRPPPKPFSSGIPTTRVVPGSISLIPGSNPFGKWMMKDSLAKMTQPEINQLTTRHTERNRRYHIDFERKVVRVERDRSSSPDAKTQHHRALEDRMKRYEVQEETGIVLGPGDPMDYEPETKTPTRKGVRWHADLEFGWDEDLEKNSPSAAKKKAMEGVKGIVRKQVPLDPFGNVVGPLPRIRDAPEKVVVSKVLYIGEDDE